MSEAEACPKCPHCGAGQVYPSPRIRNVTGFSCGTWASRVESHQGRACRVAQLEQQLAQAKDELQRATQAFMVYASGDITVRWNPDGFWAYGQGVSVCGPFDSALESVLAALKQRSATTPTA